MTSSKAYRAIYLFHLKTAVYLIKLPWVDWKGWCISTTRKRYEDTILWNWNGFVQYVCQYYLRYNGLRILKAVRIWYTGRQQNFEVLVSFWANVLSVYVQVRWCVWHESNSSQLIYLYVNNELLPHACSFLQRLKMAMTGDLVT